MVNSLTNTLTAKKKRAFFFLFFFILIIYSNTFNASWHLDDEQCIVNNPSIKIKDLSYESIYRTFHSGYDERKYKKDNIYRPIPCLTFALNYYFDGLNVRGFHAVNILIHFLTAYFLYLSILTLLNSPKLKNKYKDSEFFIAFLSALLWAVNPIQTQAVTYIVQRMASMAAMFFIVGIFFYIKARITVNKRKRMLLFLSCVLSFMAGIASKENAILLPFSLVILEFTFFQDFRRPKTKKMFIYVILFAFTLITLTGFFLFIKDNNLTAFLDKYDSRPYTISQRLMTEARVVIFYLTQIFYPVPTRLSIEHDFTISTSLFHPWSTLPSIALVLFLIVFGLSQIQKRPTVSFAILFFFLNHSIESTIVPLEILFEHRNYLPSFFLFFPLVIGLKQAIDFYNRNNRLMRLILLSFVTLLLTGFGAGTYIRNMSWHSEKTLWEDALKHAPSSNRVFHNLAWGYYEKIKNYDKALELYKKALDLNMHSPALARSWAMNNIANIHYLKKEYQKAFEIWKEAVDISPDFDRLRLNFAYVAGLAGHDEISSENLDIVIANNPDNLRALKLKGLLLLRQGKPEIAVYYFTQCLKINRFDRSVLENIGITYYFMNDYHRAELFLKFSQQYAHPSFLSLLWLIEVNRNAGDNKDTKRYIDTLFSSVTLNGLEMNFKNIYEKGFDTPVPENVNMEFIFDKLRKKLNDTSVLINKQ